MAAPRRLPRLGLLLLVGAVVALCCAGGVLAMERQSLGVGPGAPPTPPPDTDGSRAIYYNTVLPAVLRLRADNPGSWYEKVPALFAELRKPYTDAQWDAIMSHGVSHPSRSGPQ